MIKKKKNMKSSIADFDFTAPAKKAAEEAPQGKAEGVSEQAPEAAPPEQAAPQAAASAKAADKGGQAEPGAGDRQEGEALGDKPFLEAQGESVSTGPNRVLGVFSRQKISKIGTGTTQRRVLQQSYYFVEETPDGQVSVQPLTPMHVPSGDREIMDRDTFLEQFLPEPEMYQKEVLPKLRNIQKNMARGDRYRKQGKTFSAEMEYGNVLKIDEDNIRANFSIGLCYLERDDKAKAHEVFERLVKLNSSFEQEHKHLFNEFGINLRKSKMLEQAVDYYRRALELTQNDENLHYNAARALFELGRFKETAEHLKECLRMNPTHPEARKFVEYLRKKKQLRGGPVDTPKGRKENGAKPES